MADPPTPAPAPHGEAGHPAGPAPAAVLRTVSWLLLVLALVADTAASFAGVPAAVDLGLGAVTALCVAALLALYLRGRR